MSEYLTREDLNALEEKFENQVREINNKIGNLAKRDTAQKIFDQLNSQNDRIYELEKKTALLESMIVSLKELPESISSLRDSVLEFKNALDRTQNNVVNIEDDIRESLEGAIKRIDKLEKGLDTQEKRGKIDVVEWITQHWDKLVVALLIIYLTVKSII